jgi:two-component system NtrC family sensor kinase
MIEIDRLRRALVNLVLNACQAMPAGGPITVVVAPGERDGSARIGIRDAGEGIAPENLPRIFTPFFSTKPAGTGLGLSIVRAIAEDHDGRVDVETSAGKGTTFWLLLYSELERPDPSLPRRSVAP